MNILSIQSSVVFGHVGNSAARFALQRLGLDVWAVPTVLLSNHPGHGRFRGEATAEPGSESALNNLLNIIGKRQGASSVISIG